VQAATISINLARHRRRFLLGRDVHVLDPRIERSEIERLVRWRSGRWEDREAIARFRHYDDKRLSQLRMHARHGSRFHIALVRLFQLKKIEYEPPAQQLSELAMQPRPDAAAVDAAIDAVVQERNFDLHYLKSAREALNSKGHLEKQRRRLVEVIVGLS